MSGKPYLEFDEDAVWESVKDAAEVAAMELRSDHSWTNRTGDLEKAIPSKVEVSADYIEFAIPIEYASYVDVNRPYVDELKRRIDILSQEFIAFYLEGINQ